MIFSFFTWFRSEFPSRPFPSPVSLSGISGSVYCSIFNSQGPIRCCPLQRQLIYYISSIAFCQQLFSSFLKSFLRFPPAYRWSLTITRIPFIVNRIFLFFKTIFPSTIYALFFLVFLYFVVFVFSSFQNIVLVVLIIVIILQIIKGDVARRVFTLQFDHATSPVLHKMLLLYV